MFPCGRQGLFRAVLRGFGRTPEILGVLNRGPQVALGRVAGPAHVLKLAPRRLQILGGSVAFSLGPLTKRSRRRCRTHRLITCRSRFQSPFPGFLSGTLRRFGLLACLITLGGGGPRDLLSRRSRRSSLLSVTTGIITFRVRGRDLPRRLRADLSDLPLHSGRRHLRVQSLSQRPDKLIKPIDDLPRTGDLPRQPRRLTMPHPHVA